MNDDLNVLALVKGEDKYIFLFDDKNRTQTLRMLGRYAADPELSFSWYDAAILSQRIRDMTSPEPAATHASDAEHTTRSSNRRFNVPAPKDKR